MAESVGAPGINWAFELAREFLTETLSPDRVVAVTAELTGQLREIPLPPELALRAGRWLDRLQAVAGAHSPEISRRLTRLALTWLDGKQRRATLPAKQPQRKPK